MHSTSISQPLFMFPFLVSSETLLGAAYFSVELIQLCPALLVGKVGVEPNVKPFDGTNAILHVLLLN